MLALKRSMLRRAFDGLEFRHGTTWFWSLWVQRCRFAACVCYIGAHHFYLMMPFSNTGVQKYTCADVCHIGVQNCHFTMWVRHGRVRECNLTTCSWHIGIQKYYLKTSCLSCSPRSRYLTRNVDQQYEFYAACSFDGGVTQGMCFFDRRTLRNAQQPGARTTCLSYWSRTCIMPDACCGKRQKHILEIHTCLCLVMAAESEPYVTANKRNHIFLECIFVFGFFTLFSLCWRTSLIFGEGYGKHLVFLIDWYQV